MNTIAGVDVTNYVRLMLDDTDSSDYTLTDTQLNDLLTQAVRDYSSYAPYVLESTFATAINQALYKLASTVLNVLEVDYAPGLGRTDTDTLPDYLPGLEWWHDEAIAWIRQRMIHNYRKQGRGYWAQVTGLTSYTAGVFVYLYPSPDEVETITYRYTALHPLVGTDYPTIPPHHTHFLRDWVIALGKLSQASGLDGEPLDYDAGQTRFRTGDKSVTVRRAALGELRRIQQALTPNLSRMR